MARFKHTNKELESAAQSGKIVTSFLQPSPGANTLILLLVALTIVLLIVASILKINRSVAAPGQVVANANPVKITAPVAGVVSRVYVADGNRVIKGEPLAEISINIGLNRSGDVTGQKTKRITRELNDLEDLRRGLNGVRERYHQTDADRLTLLTTQREHLYKVVNMLKLRVDNDKAELQKQSKLSSKGVVPKINKSVAQQQLIATRLELEKAKLAVAQMEERILDAHTGSMEIVYQFHERMTELDQSISRLKENKLETNLSNAYRVFAPVNGIVSGLHISQGSSVSHPGDTLIELSTGSDNNSTINIELFVRSRNIKAVTVGSTVRVEISALEVMDYGLFEGVVQSISTTTLSNAARQSRNNIPDQLDLFLVNVELIKEQSSKLKALVAVRSGMELTGHISTSRLSILAAVLEPITRALNLTIDSDSG